MASRSTFRDPATDVSWQKQLRDRYEAEGVPPVPHLDVKRAIVRPVSRKLAEQIILKYEWLGTMARTRWYYGIFFGPYCAGVCCVGDHTATGGANVYREFNIERNELAVLARGACVHWAPVGANSKLVSWTCRLIAKDAKVKVIIAYSDTDAGEIGTIYQACNWVCIGRSSVTSQMIAPNGRIYDQKVVYNTQQQNKKRGVYLSWSEQREALINAGWVPQQTNPKHRYVSILDRSDKALVARIERMRQPYPKRTRAGSVDSDAAADHAAEGGAMPTPALQSVNE